MCGNKARNSLSFSVILITLAVQVDSQIGTNLTCSAKCISVTTHILKSIQRENRAGIGQIIAANHWFNQRDAADLADFLPHFRIPWIIYGMNAKLHVFNFSISVASFKFSPSNFAHLQQHTSHSAGIGSLDSVKLTLYLYFRFTAKLAKLKSPPYAKDLFITTFTPSNSMGALRGRLHSKFHVWITCKSDEEAETPNMSGVYHYHDYGTCLYASRKSYEFLVKTNACCGPKIHILGYSNPSTNKTGLAAYGRGLSQYPNNSIDLPTDDLINLKNRKIFPNIFRKNDVLYGSLVFIAKKIPENNASPFTIASWIGILTAYTVTAIVFGVIKIVTMNNLDNSWYECILNQFMSFVNEEKMLQKTKINTISNNISVLNITDENANLQEGQDDKMVLRRISVRSNVLPEVSAEEHLNDSAYVVIHDFHHNRGKMSKAILYGTIRVVSFILLAMYEGKLYNTITFPKSKLMASFDELISNEKYFIKVSNEAAKYENFTTKISVNDLSKYAEGVTVTSENRSSKVIESVNILDCVNWVEAGPDSNHACVGYEFELRNLHKAQKSDKILVKSKQKLLRFSSSNSLRLGRRRGFTLFPGGFQISKWILESGILQLWSIVENAFMESLINPNWSDPFKVFTIRDYLGLFVVYALLLILASIMFLLEHSIALGKKMFKNKKFKSARKVAWKHCKRFINLTCGGFVLCCHNIPTVKVKYVKWRAKKYSRSLNSMNRMSV